MPADGTAIAYISCSKGGVIEVVSVDGATGALRRLETIALSGDGMPLAMAPDGGHLYAAVYGRNGDTAEPRFETYRVDPASGGLQRVSIVKAPGRMSFITVDRSGKFLLGASVANSLISSYRIGDGGGVEDAPVEVREVPSKAHQVTTDRTNRFAFVPNLGGDIVQQLTFDASTGRFSDNAPPAVSLPAGAGPRHMAHHPGGRFVVLLCEVDGALVSYEIEENRGTLREVHRADILPGGFSGEPWGAQIHVTPDGRFLITSERRSSTLTVHAISAMTGATAKLSSYVTEACPRGFDIDASGRWVLVAGETSDRVSSYSLDPGSGDLELCASLDVGAGPIWVEMPKTA